MKKTELLKLGVPESKIKQFQQAYWADLYKVAQRMNEQKQEGSMSSTGVDLVGAITAMVKLIHDPERLRVILNNVNRHYAMFTQEQREREKKDSENKGNADQVQESLSCDITGHVTPCHVSDSDSSHLVEVGPVEVDQLERMTCCEGGDLECP